MDEAHVCTPASLQSVAANFSSVRSTTSLDVPVADIGVGPFAAFLVVGAKCEQIVFAVLSGADVVIVVTPGIFAHPADVTTFAPVANRRVTGFSHECRQ